MVPGSPDQTGFDRVVEAAARCFAEVGVAQATLEQVATAAGMHRVTLHRHVPGGRDQLVDAVVRREVDRVGEACLEAVAAAPDAAEALVEAFALVVLEARSNQVIQALLTDDAVVADAVSSPESPPAAIGREIWRAIRDRADREGLPSDRVADRDALDLLLRLTVSLSLDPGRVADGSELRAYTRRLIVPALLSPSP